MLSHLTDNMKKLFSIFCRGPQANLKNMMAVAGFALAFCGFLRFDELAEVDMHHELMVFLPTHVRLFIRRSKTDQHMSGTWVFIARLPSSEFCPVALLEQVLQLGQYLRTPSHEQQDVGPFLHAVSHTRNGYVLQQIVGSLDQPIRSLSYTTVREKLLSLCLEVGITKRIGLHSLHIGGVLSAAEGGLSDRLCKKGGRWVSKHVKDAYIRESLDNILSISRSVGLG